MDMVGALGKQENVDALLAELKAWREELQKWRELFESNAVGLVPKKEQS